MENNRVSTCQGIQEAITGAAFTEGVQAEVPVREKPWRIVEVMSLVDKRRHVSGQIERTQISKLIQKVTRRELRKWSSLEARRVLKEFAQLDRMDGIH